MHFLFVWMQTLRDGRTLYSSKSIVFLFYDFNGFWWQNDVTRLWAKLKFQDMAKQIILKKAQQDRIECEKIFWRAQLIKEFFPSFCYYFDVISPKAIELFQNFFSHFFLSHHTLSRLFISFPITWNLNFVVNLVSILWNWKT